MGKILYIFPKPLSWSWLRRFSICAAIFGGLWLLLEPLVAFANPETDTLLGSLGLWRYLILVILSIAMTGIFEFFNRTNRMGKFELISFTVISETNGSQYKVKTPKDLKTGIFADLFLEKTNHERSSDMHFDLYTNTLVILTSDNHKLPVSPDLTLAQNNITDGIVALIEGQIKMPTMLYSQIVYRG